METYSQSKNLEFQREHPMLNSSCNFIWHMLNLAKTWLTTTRTNLHSEVSFSKVSKCVGEKVWVYQPLI